MTWFPRVAWLDSGSIEVLASGAGAGCPATARSYRAQPS